MNKQPQAWRFALILLALLSALLAWGKPWIGGDVLEYLGDTVALAAHRSPDIRIEDLGSAKPLAPELAPVYDVLAEQMRTNTPRVFQAFARGREGKVYSIHFFGYSMLVAVPFKALEKLHQPPLKAFQVVNLAAVFVLGLALLRFFGSSARAFGGVALFMLCGGWLYWDWTSPECLSAAALLSALLLFASGAPVAAGLLAGLASQQNPTIVMFFGFAPLLLALQAWRNGATPAQAVRSVLGARNIAGLAVGLALFALPPLFNLYHFGVPSIIAKWFSDPSLVSGVRLVSFFFDLNQGMFLAIPAVAVALLAWGWGRAGERGKQALVLAGCALFTLALALPTLVITNWNSGAAGLMRYAFWAAMPLLFALLLRLREQERWPLVPVLLFVAVQAGSMVYAKSYPYIEFSPLAQRLLDRAPDLYHPEPEIFAERMARNDDGIQKDKIYVYKVAGRPVKTLINIANPAAEGLLCGEGGALAPETRIVASAHGWRYIDGQPQCLEGGLPQQRFKADQFEAGVGISLAAGWNGVERSGEPWNGVWSNGAHSRILVTPAGGLHPATVSFTGHYYDGNKRTRVGVNGIDLGWHQLDREGPIALPPQVATTRLLEFDLENEAPALPGGADTRRIAFFLRELDLRASASTTARNR